MDSQNITELMKQTFQPVFVSVRDTSYLHTPEEHSETLKAKERCFDLVIVSNHFEKMNPVARHRAVYQALDVGENESIHSVTIKAFTVSEWEKQKQFSRPVSI